MLTKYPSLEGLASTFGVPTLQAVFGGVFSRLQALGTALTNSTSLTPLASKSIPANGLRIGVHYRLRGMVRATATNSTDTLTCKLLIAGSEVLTTGEVDVADNNSFIWDVEVWSLSAPAASVTLYWRATYSILGSTSTVTARGTISTVDTTAAVACLVNGQWSAASASNSCRAEQFDVYANRGDA